MDSEAQQFLIPPMRQVTFKICFKEARDEKNTILVHIAIWFITRLILGLSVRLPILFFACTQVFNHPKRAVSNRVRESQIKDGCAGGRGEHNFLRRFSRFWV